MSDPAEQDRQDPLASFRDRFQIPEGVIYLDGNSLGCLPKATVARMQAVITEEWGQGLIRSWNDAGWIELPQRLGRKLAPLLGASADEVLVTDSTSINLFKLAAAAMKLRPGRQKIITEPGNFPTDRYILQGLCDFMTGEPELVTLPLEDIPSALDDDTALVVLTHVHYKTGHRRDMAQITRQVQASGTLMLWDLSHTAGAMPVDLSGTGVDMAVGCGYKYLNGGPGAPAFVYVRADHQRKLQQPIYGWFGHAEPFAMSDDYEPHAGLERTLTGTTGVLGASALEVGLDLFADVDMDALRNKSEAVTRQLIEGIESRCGRFGFELASPREDDQRGSQVSFHHPEGYAIMRALIDRGVIGDFRAPDIVRFGVAPLYLRYQDIADAVDILHDIMRRETWNSPDYKARQAVT